MTNGLMNQLKSDFAFLNIDDDVFEQVFNRCIDKKKSEVENKKRIYEIFYKIIRDDFIKNEDYTNIIKYIDDKFDSSNVKKAIESLNKLSILLEQCGIDINKKDYDKLINGTPKLKKCIDLIVSSNEIIKEKKLDLLDEKSSDIIEYYIEDNDIFLEDSFSVNELVNNNIEEIEEESVESSVYTNNALTAYLKNMSKYPLLTAEEEYNLTKMYRKTHDKDIRDKIINSNLRYVVSIAKSVNRKYKGQHSLTFLELISAGNECLITAIEDYDPDKGRITTYVGPLIYRKIVREIHENGTAIRIPVAKHEKMITFYKEKEKLQNKLNREPTVLEIEQQLGYKENKIAEFENNIGKTIVSLNTKILDDANATELIDVIPDSTAVIPEDYVLKKDLGYIEMLFEGLSETEKLVMKLRTGIYDGTEYKLEEIGMMLHRLKLKDRSLTRERVRQIEKRALRRMKKNKDKYERNLEMIGNCKEKIDYVDQTITTNDVIDLIRNTDKEIMSSVLDNMCKSYKVILKECFGEDILAARLQNPTREMIKHLLTIVYPKILSGVRKNTIIGEIDKIVLPSNIYNVDDRYTKEEVEMQIDVLEPFERLILNKFYDIYIGNLHKVQNITPYEKEQIVKVINKIKIGLIRYRTPRDAKKGVVSKNKLFEYFGEKNKELVIPIINSLPEKDTKFLQTWYGENYDIDPRINGELYNKMDKSHRDVIFNKVKIRLDRFKLLQERKVDITIEQFVKSKRTNKCSKDNIYTYFGYEGYTEEEITFANSQLSDSDKELLTEYYGSNLKHPVINPYMPDELKQRVLTKVYNKIRVKLVNTRNTEKEKK